MREQVGWPYQPEGVFIQRRRGPAPQVVQTDEEGDSIYSERAPSSAIRYRDTRGNQVIRQGTRKVVIHREAAPSRRGVFFWCILMGLLMFAMICGWLILTAAGYWWQSRQDDWKYGVPRTYQTDQFVGHADNPAHPDHFIAVNTGGMIEVIELNVLNPKYDRVYPITTSEDPLTPVALGFEDTRHIGKLDMLVIIGDTNPYTVVLLNNGNQFTH